MFKEIKSYFLFALGFLSAIIISYVLFLFSLNCNQLKAPPASYNTKSKTSKHLPQSNKIISVPYVELKENKSRTYHQPTPTTSVLTTTNSTSSKVTKVLLLTHYRGGSTFLGQMFNQNPAALYWFEPIKALEWKFDSSLNSDDIERLNVDVLNHMFSCQMDLVLRDVMVHYFITGDEKTLSGAPYRKCLGGDLLRYQECLPLLIDECTASNLRVIKSIRFRMKAVWKLLEMDPSLKVVLYTRDPRAMMLSQMDILPGFPLEENAIDQCAKMENDLFEYDSMLKNYPNQLMMLKYEDLVNQPEKNIKVLYDFVGKEVPTELDQWITKNMKESDKAHYAYGTERNSTYVVNRWKKGLNSHQKKIIENSCINVLLRLQYL